MYEENICIMGQQAKAQASQGITVQPLRGFGNLQPQSIKVYKCSNQTKDI